MVQNTANFFHSHKPLKLYDTYLFISTKFIIIFRLRIAEVEEYSKSNARLKFDQDWEFRVFDL